MSRILVGYDGTDSSRRARARDRRGARATSPRDFGTLDDNGRLANLFRGGDIDADVQREAGCDVILA